MFSKTFSTFRSSGPAPQTTHTWFLPSLSIVKNYMASPNLTFHRHSTPGTFRYYIKKWVMMIISEWMSHKWFCNVYHIISDHGGKTSFPYNRIFKYLQSMNFNSCLNSRNSHRAVSYSNFIPSKWITSTFHNKKVILLIQMATWLLSVIKLENIICKERGLIFLTT